MRAASVLIEFISAVILNSLLCIQAMCGLLLAGEREAEYNQIYQGGGDGGGGVECFLFLTCNKVKCLCALRICFVSDCPVCQQLLIRRI